MAQTLAGDRTLTIRDAAVVYQELLPARYNAHLLGFMLNVKPVDMSDILINFKDPKDRLMRIIMKILGQIPSPTWRTFVNALRSPVVGLKDLANHVEATHFLESERIGKPTSHFKQSVWLNMYVPIILTWIY